MKRFLILAVLSVLLAPVYAQHKIGINPDVKHQTIECFGAADAWSGNFSRFVRPGYVRVALDGADNLDTLAGTAFISSDGGQLVAVFVNSSFEDIPVDIALGKKWQKNIADVTTYVINFK